MLNRLLVYFKAIQKMQKPISVSKELAEELLACKENRRSMKLEQIFNKVLGMQKACSYEHLMRGAAAHGAWFPDHPEPISVSRQGTVFIIYLKPSI